MATILVDDIFKCILFYEDEIIQIQISMKFIPEGPIDNKPALVQVMACPGDKPLSELMMVCLLLHICVTQPQWINYRNGFVLYRQKYTSNVQNMWLLCICIYVCIYVCIHACMIACISV